MQRPKQIIPQVKQSNTRITFKRKGKNDQMYVALANIVKNIFQPIT